MTAPLLSIITPVYNMEAYLDEAIQSILKQDFTDFEFLMVDDCSTDSSKEILERYAAEDSRIKVHSTSVNSWAHAAANVALDHAQGKYVYILDSDDKIIEGVVKKQVAFMEENPDIDVCGGWFQCFGSTNKLMSSYERDNGRIRMGMLFDSTLGHGGTVIRRELIEKHGIRYNTDIYYTHDYHFFTQLAFDAQARFTSLPMAVYLYRMHAGQTSTALNDKQRGFSDVVRGQMLDRLGVTDEIVRQNHLHFCHKTPGYIDDPVKNIPAYYQAVIAANKASELFPAEAFEPYIAEKVFKNLSRLGPKGKDTFNAMPKDFKSRFSLKEKTLLFVKSLRKAKM